MNDKESEKAGAKSTAPAPSKKVRLLNGRKVGKIFIEDDIGLEPGDSAVIDRKTAEYLVKLGGVIVENS